MEVFGVLFLIGGLFLLPSIKLYQRGRVQGYGCVSSLGKTPLGSDLTQCRPEMNSPG
jgi:hypothetical protein